MALIGQQSPVRNWSRISRLQKPWKKIHKVICNTFECIIETQRLYCFFGGFEYFFKRERGFLTFDQLAGLAFISMRGPSHTRRLKQNLNGVIFFQKLGQVAASYTRGMLKHTPRRHQSPYNVGFSSLTKEVTKHPASAIWSSPNALKYCRRCLASCWTYPVVAL